MFPTVCDALAWVRIRLTMPDPAGTAAALRAAFDRARWLHQDTERLMVKARSALAKADRLLKKAEGDPSEEPGPPKG